MTSTDEIAARLRDTAETYADGVFLANRLAVLAVIDDRDAKAAEIEELTARVGELERAQKISHELAMDNGAAFITASALLDKAAKALGRSARLLRWYAPSTPDEAHTQSAPNPTVGDLRAAASVLAEIEAFRKGGGDAP